MSLLNYIVRNSVLICTPQTLLKDILIYIVQLEEYGHGDNEVDQTIFNLQTSDGCQFHAVQEELSTNSSTLTINKGLFKNKINHSLDCIYIVEGTQLLGILNIIDIIKLIYAGIDLGNLTVCEVMQEPIVTVKPGFDVNTILNLMCQLGIRNLAVVDDAEQFLDVISLESLVRELQQEIAQTQEQLQSEISQRCSLELALKKSQIEVKTTVNHPWNQSLQPKICQSANQTTPVFSPKSDFQEIFPAFPDLYLRLDADGKILSYYKKQDDELQISDVTFIGKYIQNIMPFDVAHKFQQGLAQLKQTKSLVAIEYSLPTADGKGRFEARFLPSIQEQVIVIIRNIIKNRKALYISEERYIRAINAGKVGIWEWNIQTNKIYIDPNFLATLGYTAQEIPTYFDEWLQLVHPDDIEAVKNAIHASLSSQTLKYEIEHRMLDKHGNYIWFLTRGNILRDDMGVPCFMAGSNTDITARKQAENKLKSSLKEKEVLLKEIHHRVKNNLQIISSLLRLQAKYIDDEKAYNIFQDSQHRIRAMAMIHENLYQSNNLAKIEVYDYINKLTKNLICSYGVRSDIQIHLDIDNIYLKIDTAIPCGLIINELVSNALKHAFQHSRSGEIFVRFLDLYDGQYSLTVSDNGTGLPKDIEVYKNQSLGLQLVWNLVEQLEGNIRFQQTPNTLFTITFTEAD